jgi:Family of unknown function (DUF5331)
VNTQHFRESVKTQWLNYYIDNRDWIIRLQIWVNCEGQRRPSASFMLATLAILEPNLHQMLPLIVDLTSNPDRIIAALGLNFTPDDHPQVIQHLQKQQHDHTQDSDFSDVEDSINHSIKMLSAGAAEIKFPTAASPPKQVARMDETCMGEDNRRRSLNTDDQ